MNLIFLATNLRKLIFTQQSAHQRTTPNKTQAKHFEHARKPISKFFNHTHDILTFFFGYEIVFTTRSASLLNNGFTLASNIFLLSFLANKLIFRRYIINMKGKKGRERIYMGERKEE